MSIRPALFLTIWILSAIWVNPIGEFPQNDDWAYAKTVKQLHETGQYELSDWAAPNSLTNVIWGYFFTFVFGFSF